MTALRILIAIGTIHLLLVASSAQTESRSNESGYYGPVVSVQTDTTQYSLDGNRLRPARRKVDSFERFDTSGRLVEEKYFKEDGSILWQYRHSYDSHGRRVESKGTHSRFTYLSDRIVYKYDSAGNLVAESGFDAQEKLVSKSEYAYDEKRRKIRWTSMSYHPEEHSRPHQWTYNYYDSGLVKEERAFAEEHEGFRPTDSLGAPHRKLFLYDSGNKPVFVLLYSVNDAFAGLESKSYDKRGNEIEEIRYEANGALKDKTKYSYRFDKFGNWRVQETYEWDSELGRYRLSERSYQVIEYRK